MSTATIEGLDINQIKEYLPHRYPFLLVDRVRTLIPGVRATGYKNVTANEEFFNGHFPFKPIMPGVLMVEALAQLGCICLLAMEGNKGALAVFTGIDGLKFRHMVQPGDRIDMEVELVKMRGPLGKAKCIAKVDDKLAVEGEISFALTWPNGKPASQE
jgi:3-hydroxyacyl-[acyl-carrier-protein] dehydratase